MSSPEILCAEDSIRINDLSLSVPLRTGAQWATESAGPVDQPISVSISIFFDISTTAETDDLSHSLNYADIAQKVRASIGSDTFVCIQDLSRHLSDTVAKILMECRSGLDVLIRVNQLKAPLHAKCVAVEQVAKCLPDGSWTASKIVHYVEDLICPTIIGINAAERWEKQDVVLNLCIDTGPQGLAPQEWIDLRVVTKEVYEEVSSSTFDTLEALTSFTANRILSILKSYQPSPVVLVRIAKPSALVFANSAEVHVRRTFEDFPNLFGTSSINSPNLQISTSAVRPLDNPSLRHIAAIALGSNLGDSFHNIEYALRLLEHPEDLLRGESAQLIASPFVEVVDTSFLYETKPMYVTDQPSFINCACMIETDLPPKHLLQLLKTIELNVGRVPSIRNGPRAVDLDIIFYDNDIIDTRDDKTNLEDLEGTLIIPHPRLQEREFVLRPLNDMIPDYQHPVLKKTVQQLLSSVYDPTQPPIKKVLPFPSLPLEPSVNEPPFLIQPAPNTLCSWSHRTSQSSRGDNDRTTHVMATLNVTPDSFSDGATNNTLPAALKYISSALASGASIIDVGGYSTRPGAAFVSVEDEIARVLPVIQAMRDENYLNNLDAKQLALDLNVDPTRSLGSHIEHILRTPISVDTFRWEVAEAALQAGANCINDVYGFTGPDSWPLDLTEIEAADSPPATYMRNLKAVARRYAVPVVLMHSRGDAGQNKDYGNYAYASDSRGRGAVLEGVRVELGAKVDAIVKGKGGVRRWLVIADPGIGFSKTLEGNLELLRAAKDVVLDVRIGDATTSGMYRNPLRGFPQLIGTSRKSFLGAILASGPEGRETKPADRTLATAAAVACAVQQDALVVRIHDVREMMDVVKVAEALYS